MEDRDDDLSPISKKLFPLSTEFFQWSCKHFAQPVMRMSDNQDPESLLYQKQQFNMTRNSTVETEAQEEQLRAG